jgi:hypothetical protein
MRFTSTYYYLSSKYVEPIIDGLDLALSIRVRSTKKARLKFLSGKGFSKDK